MLDINILTCKDREGDVFIILTLFVSWCLIRLLTELLTRGRPAFWLGGTGNRSLRCYTDTQRLQNGKKILLSKNAFHQVNTLMYHFMGQSHAYSVFGEQLDVYTLAFYLMPRVTWWPLRCHGNYVPMTIKMLCETGPWTTTAPGLHSRLICSIKSCH